MSAVLVGCEHRISQSEFMTRYTSVAMLEASPKPVEVSPEMQSTVDQALATYTLGPDDVLAVFVTVSAEMAGPLPVQVRVDSDGNIELPLVGKVDVNGLTLGKGKRKVCLLTSVLSKSRLSDRQIGKLYRLRWGVEVLYRTFKQTLGHKKLRSDNPRHAKVELDWAMLGLWMLGLMSWQARGRRCRRRWSPAQSVRAVRHAARHAHSPCQREALKKQLRDAVIDEYRRTGSKKARKWPHKKTEKPPGKPKVRMATETEVQTAHKVKQLKLAG